MSILVQKRMRIWYLGAAALAALLITGCASQHAYLVPAPTDNLTNGGHAAMGMAEGVRITVTPNSWNGKPRNLYKRVTPLKVRIVNHSKQPLRLVYHDFKLQTAQGFQLAALPPSEIRGKQYASENGMGYDPQPAKSATKITKADPKTDPDVDHGRANVIITPGFDWDDFYYAPYWGYGYAGIGPWPYWWGPNLGYYNTYFPYMRSVHLPTRSMLRKGIPEGVIAPNGYVRGFLYFTRVNPGMSRVEFVAHLQNARTGKIFGTIRIPLQVMTK